MKKIVKEHINEGLGDKFLELKGIIKSDIKDYDQEIVKKSNDILFDEIIYIYNDLRTNKFKIYKNPKSLDLIGTNARAILLKNGDLYIEENANCLHYEMIDGLIELGVINEISTTSTISENFDEFSCADSGFIALQRYLKSNTLYLAESYPYKNMKFYTHDLFVELSRFKKDAIKLLNTVKRKTPFNYNIERITEIERKHSKNLIDEGVADKFLQSKNIIKNTEKNYNQIHAKKESKNQYDEVFKFYDEDNNKINIYKNPTNINLIGENARGVLMSNGDLYISEFPFPIHLELIEFLVNLGIIDKKWLYDYVWSEENPNNTGFLAIQRYGKSNKLRYSEIYPWQSEKESKHFRGKFIILLKDIKKFINNTLINSNIFVIENKNINESIYSQYHKKYLDSSWEMGEYIGKMKSLFPPHEQMKIYKNPQSLKKFYNSVRAVLTKELDLYVIDHYNGIHEELLIWLNDNDIINNVDFWNEKPQETDFICLTKDNNNLLLSESYKKNIIENNKEYLLDFFNRANDKFSNINFLVKSIIYESKLVREGLGDKFLSNKYITTDIDDVDYDREYAKLKNEKDYDEVVTISDTNRWSNKTNFFKIYKNPRNINLIGFEARGVLMSNGDLYISESFEPIHYSLVEHLINMGIIDETWGGKDFDDESWTYTNPIETKFLCVQRFRKTNELRYSESYQTGMTSIYRNKIEPYINNFIENIKLKTNIFKLVFKSILDESLSDKFLQKKGIINIDTHNDTFTSNKEHHDIYKVKTHFIIGGKKFYNVYKNPSSLDLIGTDARGVILATGDLYLSESFYPLHDEIVEFLVNKKIINKDFNHNWGRKSPQEEGFLTIQRVDDSDLFILGGSNYYSQLNIPEIKNNTQEFIDKVNSSQKLIKVINEN